MFFALEVASDKLMILNYGVLCSSPCILGLVCQWQENVGRPDNAHYTQICDPSEKNQRALTLKMLLYLHKSTTVLWSQNQG